MSCATRSTVWRHSTCPHISRCVAPFPPLTAGTQVYLQVPTGILSALAMGPQVPTVGTSAPLQWHGRQVGTRAFRLWPPRLLPRRTTATRRRRRRARKAHRRRGRQRRAILCKNRVVVCTYHAKNKVVGRIMPFSVLGFWVKSTGICAGAMPYRRDFTATTRI